MPTFGDDEALPTTVHRIQSALELLASHIEWLILYTPSVQGRTPPTALSSLVGARIIIVQERGKAHALQVGAVQASGDILLVLDADTCPERNALATVLAPICDGTADVCAGHVVIGPPIRQTRVAFLLHAWARASSLVWHLARLKDPSSRWALPGPLYAIRHSFFPAQVQFPLIDDASIGLHALQAGARFAYARMARTAVLPPGTYADWLRQKLRVRRGWARLRKHSPERYAGLRRTMDTQQRRLAKRLGCWFRLLVLHDRALVHVATLLDRILPSTGGRGWQTVRTTKGWNTN